jgi:hypothetical protein
VTPLKTRLARVTWMLASLAALATSLCASRKW